MTGRDLSGHVVLVARGPALLRVTSGLSEERALDSLVVITAPDEAG